MRSEEKPADFTLNIGEISLDIGRNHVIKTLAYNGRVPAPLLRMKEGRPVAVDVFNGTRDPEVIHWHGFQLPAEVDGSREEGTPIVQARDRRRYIFTPGPSGTRWYHTHAMAGTNLNRGLYTGQFGLAIVEPRENPGRYDLEIPIVLHEWQPYFSSENEMDVDYRSGSINGKMLGAGEPLRVRTGQRALFRVLNASATMPHRLALAGHHFLVIALDGNRVASPRSVPLLELAPGERVDAIVEMKNPGAWILGEQNAKRRAAGMGIVVEYANARGPAQWIEPAHRVWDYAAFGAAAQAVEPEITVPLVFEKPLAGHGWLINGKSFPDTDPIRVPRGRRVRFRFDNRSTTAHPVHLHRHIFDLAAGVRKDIVTVAPRSMLDADFTADQPGPSLFHCHQQFHMDYGFMALMECS